MALPKRIIKETERLAADPAPGISASPHEDNLRYFDVTIAGPGGSPFEGGVFRLELFLPEEYPMNPPKVRFLTKIYHPNIDKLGRICLDILKDKWSPALQIRTVLLSIQALLSAPNPDDPLATDVAKHYKENEADAKRGRFSPDWQCRSGKPLRIVQGVTSDDDDGWIVLNFAAEFVWLRYKVTMSGSTAAPLYSVPYTPTMSSHLVDAGDNNSYLTSSVGAGPSTGSGHVNGENTPGSTKRPFPWASESERDKRPRSGSGGGNPSTSPDDEETMSTDESAYASAAESPNFSRSPTRAEWPLSVVDEAPRIPTLRSASPLELGNLSQSGFRPISPATTTRAANEPRIASERTPPLDLGWLTRQLDEALPPPRDRAFSLSYGSASVDSALPRQHSRAASTRVPLPWVDIEGGLLQDSLSASLGPDSVHTSPAVASTVTDSPPTRQPLSLSLLPDSPSSAFPTSASPRTSAFDLAVTPPGSALPSFVARMMEVDSPVRGGGDSYISSQADTYIPSTETYVQSTDQSETYIPSPSPQPEPQPDTFVPSQPEEYASSPRAENGDASIEALGRFIRQEETNRSDFIRPGGTQFEQASEFTHNDDQGTRFAQTESAGLLRQNQGDTPSPIQAPASVAVDSYFAAHEPGASLPMGTRPEQPQINGQQFSGHFDRQIDNYEPPRASHHEQDRTEQSNRTTTDSTGGMGSIYSRRLTESGASFPSRPSDSGASLPSFRATVSPEPGRMSWSDLFGPRTPASEISVATRSEVSMATRTDGTTGARTEASTSTTSTRVDGTRDGTRADVGMASGTHTRGDPGTSRAGVRSALTRAVRLAEGPPRLHLDALPREDRTSATNLSRTPPVPDSHPLAWFEDNAPPRPRTTSSTRWTDLFPEPAAAPLPITPRSTNRTRMPPPVSTPPTDNLFDPLTGMSWNRTPAPDPPTTYDAATSLARYQTFAQSIDEIRRSPPPQPEATTWDTGSNRSSWAFPRHEPLQYEPEPQNDGDWLREWELQRDRRSRAVREDYIRRRDTDDRRQDEVPRPPPVSQLNDTQAVWPDFMGRPRPRPRPMTRASLVATGFADSDLWPETDGTNNRLWGEIPRPSRRAELLPARADDVDTPRQFLPSTHEGGIFTESPPSLLADFNDSATFSESMPGIVQPSRPDPVNFRSASRVLRASLDTSRRPSDGPAREPERSRDRWENRSQGQFERVRQLLHRSSDREASRRHPPGPPAQPNRRSFLSVLDNEIPSSTISSDSRRSSMSGVAWPRPGATETAPSRPFSLHEGDRSEWPDTSSRNNPNELLRASSVRGRRRRTLLPESASRRDSTGFLHSMNNALHQVESGLLHINRELNALADQGSDQMHRFGPQNETEPMRPHTPPRPHMDWAFESAQRNPTPPPTLPPFEFASAQRSAWPAERYNHNPGETSSLGLDLSEYPARRTSTRGPEIHYEQRQSVRDSSSTRGARPSYAHEGSWRSTGPSNEWWSNDASAPSLQAHMPMRERISLRPPASSHQSVAASRQPEPASGRNSSMGTSMQAQPSATFGRLHRRRLSPPAPPHQPSVSSSLLRPFSNQNNSTSPTRSYASRFSHFLPRRNSGRGGGGSSDDNDEWHHAEQATRRFFLRPRGRGRAPPPTGDYMRDDEFDDSYEGLLRLAARIGDAKPRGTSAEVIRSMVSCRYADSAGARAEARCPICLDDYAPDNIVTVVKKCSHWFHRECVQQWLSNSRTCPVCRGQADGEDSEPQAGPSTGASDNSWM